jgi:nucleotide-binding universal stress UspA family protein
MRVLIPYDGTKNAENALFELHNAEFGKDDEILVVITDVWLPESIEELSNARRKRRLNFERSGTSSYIPARRRLEEERFLVCEIQNRLSAEFPKLNIKVGTLPGFSLVSSEVLEKAKRWKADLIILGKLKHKVEASKNGYKSKFGFVVSEAECPVRFAYGADQRNLNFTIDQNFSFIADTENSNGKQISKTQNVSNDVGKFRKRQAKSSVQTVSSTELFEQITNPKLRRLYKTKRKIKKLATTATVTV